DLGSRRRRGSNDEQLRDNALLGAHATVCVLGACDKRACAWWTGDAHLRVPMPWPDRYPRGGVTLNNRASRPLRRNDRPREVHFRQSTGHEQPAVIRDHLHLVPTALEQGLDPVGEPVYFLVEITRQPNAELV